MVIAGLLAAGSTHSAPGAVWETPLGRFRGASADSARYSYRSTRGFLTMGDGVRLAVTWWRPVPRVADETFPVLLEYLPYRKDDSFYRRDYPLYAYFVSRGFILAKVDIRGTGGSEGRLPDREYSEAELDDAVEIIRQLARIPGSNGQVGMWGISWGGFNALQVALRRPPELKAILALHASDDLYHDDVRYIDGGLHLDPYALQIDHENGLPRTPDYPIDQAYFRDRFDTYPWVLTYLHHPVDGPFWRRNALRWQPDRLEIPVYFIGGLLDGYRDTPLRELAALRVPVKVEIGPWTHDWPDNGTPGPHYEWRDRAVRWWNYWLRGEDTGLLREPRLLLFLRAGHPPDVNQVETPGSWRFTDWPLPTLRWDTLTLDGDRRLVAWPATGLSGTAVVRLRYAPGFGTAGGDWWGENTGDMAPDDAGSLVFDGPVVEQALAVIGFPEVHIRVRAGAALATWTARLEDVGPDGQVALVTGAVLNGAEHRSSETPERLQPGERYDFAWQLHFTTWTFQPGHRIRLALSNAQFPMIWPTPYPMVSEVMVDGRSSLLLPVVSPESLVLAPDLPTPEPRLERPGTRELRAPFPPSQRISFDPVSETTVVEWRSSYAWRSATTRYDYTELEQYQTDGRNPADSRFHGEASHRIRPGARDLTLTTTIDIRSDSSAFHALVTRQLTSGGRLVRRRMWQESIPRQFH